MRINGYFEGFFELDFAEIEIDLVIYRKIYIT